MKHKEALGNAIETTAQRNTKLENAARKLIGQIKEFKKKNKKMGLENEPSDSNLQKVYFLR